MSRVHQSALIQGFDYRPDRVRGSGGGYAIAWPRSEWLLFMAAVRKSGGTVHSFMDDDCTRTTVIRDKVDGIRDLALEAYNL